MAFNWNDNDFYWNSLKSGEDDNVFPLFNISKKYRAWYKIFSHIEFYLYKYYHYNIEVINLKSRILYEKMLGEDKYRELINYTLQKIRKK